MAIIKRTYPASARRIEERKLAATVPDAPYAAYPSDAELWAFIECAALPHAARPSAAQIEADARALCERRKAHATWKARQEALRMCRMSHWYHDTARPSYVIPCDCALCIEWRAELDRNRKP